MPEHDAPGAASTAPTAGPRHLCASDDLVERGRAYVFDVLHYRAPVRAFALRFEGRVVAYINRCVHVPTEMDWKPGEFLDAEREFILCSLHGASYDPLSGRCAWGPCIGGRLTALDVREEAGQVYWYPSRDIQPAAPPFLPRQKP